MAGFTGHRQLADSAGAAAAIRQALESLQREIAGEWIALSSIADGSDQLFVQQAQAIGLSWHAILPFPRAEFARDFSRADWPTGGRHVDTMINVGCINPTKVAGTHLSLYSVNLEVVQDTYGPTIKSFKPKVTVNNDAVFARLVQSLWKDLGDARGSYACKQADPAPAGGMPPLSATACKTLASLWAAAKSKIDLCVDAAFHPRVRLEPGAARARRFVDDFEAALPVAATGPDVYNRLGELKARVDVFQHVWDERFQKSIKPGGFCREWGTCPP